MAAEPAARGPIDPDSVAGLAARGGALVLVARLSDHALIFVSRLIVARWLGPDELGLFAVALLVLTVVETLTEPGLAATLIWKRDFTHEELSVTWTTGVVRGVGLAGMMILGAPLIAGFFGAPGATPLVRGMGAVVLLHGLVGPSLVVFERSLQLQKIAVLGLLRSLVLFGVTVPLTMALDSPMAIVWASIVAEAVYVVASYVAMWVPVRPSLDITLLRDLMQYGRWITGSSIAVFLLLYLDDAVVGRVLGVGALAAYQMAYQIGCVPATEVSQMLNRVTFSAFVHLRDNPRSLMRAFLAVYELAAAVTIPLAVVLSVESDAIVDVLLGPSWAAAAAPLGILAVWGAVRALGAVLTPLLRAVGRPQVVAGMHWIMFVLTAIALLPSVHLWGLEGAAFAVLIPNLMVQLFRYPIAMRAVDGPTRLLYIRLLPVLGASAAMLAVFAALRAVGSSPTGIASLVGETALVGAVYIGVLVAMEKLGLCSTVSTGRAVLKRAWTR